MSQVIRIVAQITVIVALIVIAFTVLGLFLKNIADEKNDKDPGNPGQIVYDWNGAEVQLTGKWQGDGGTTIWMDSSVAVIDSTITSSQISLVTGLNLDPEHNESAPSSFVVYTKDGSDTPILNTSSLIFSVGKTFYNPAAKSLVPILSTTVYLTGNNLDGAGSSSDEEVLFYNSDTSQTQYIDYFLDENLYGKGSIYMYPFDEYTTELYFSAFNPDLFAKTSAAYYSLNETQRASFKLPSNFPVLWLTLYLAPNAKYGWQMEIKEIPFEDLPLDASLEYMARSTTGIQIKVRRTNIFRLYPVFMIIAFWTITFSIINYGSNVFIWDTRALDAPVIGFITGLLFVLAFFRNTAPSAPPAGCIIDFAGMYWSILAAIIFGLGVLIKYSIS